MQQEEHSCKIFYFFLEPKKPNLTAITTYKVKVEVNIIDKNYTASYTEFYDFPNKRAATHVRDKGKKGCVPHGGTLIFSSYVSSSPASTIHQKKKKKKKNTRNFKHPQKIFEILATPKKYPPFCTLTLRKIPKMHRNDP